MNQKKFTTLFLVLLLLLISIFAPIIPAAINPPSNLELTRTQNYEKIIDQIDIVDNDLAHAYMDVYLGQDFVMPINGSVSGVQMLMRRGLYPGMVNVSIRFAEDNVAPLAYGTFDGDLLTYDISVGEIVNLTFNHPCFLQKGMTYRIAVTAPYGDSDNMIGWFHSESDIFPNSDAVVSYNAGLTWEPFLDQFTSVSLDFRVNIICTRPSLNCSWTVGSPSNNTLLVFKKTSIDHIDDGYKAFIPTTIDTYQFGGLFDEGLPYNSNFTVRAYSTNDTFVKVTKTLEDGVLIPWMDNATMNTSGYSSLDNTNKVNDTYSIKINNPASTTGNISMFRHFQSNEALDSFSVHLLMDAKGSGQVAELEIQPYHSDSKYLFPNAVFSSSTPFLPGNEVAVANNTQGILNQWVLNRLYNVTYRFFYDQQNANITINDYLGNTGYVNYSYGTTAITENNTVTDGAWTYERSIEADPKKYAQTFKVTSGDDYEIEKVALWLFREGVLNGKLTVGIYNVDVAGYPTGSSLAEITVDTSTINAWPPQWYNFTFPNTCPVESGEDYAIVANCTVYQAMVKEIRWLYYNLDVYSNGNHVYYDTSWHTGNGDLNFKVYKSPQKMHGVCIKMDKTTVKSLYLDNWTEINTTETSNFVTAYNWSLSHPPVSLNTTGEHNIATITWNASTSQYSFDQVRIQKKLTGAPQSPTDGTTVYFGCNSTVNDTVSPSDRVYYGAFGYNNDTGLYSESISYAFYDAPQLWAGFTYYPLHPEVGEKINFVDDSTGNIITWKWSFGDGHTSVGKSQEHSYDSRGLFTVTLTVTDSQGNTDDHVRTVFVSTFEEPYIPPGEIPKELEGRHVIEMYDAINVNNLGISNNKIKIIVIDTGFTPSTYDGVNMQNIEGYALSRFDSIYDDNGHGTFVLYEIMYITQNKCPNADIVSFKTFDKYGSAEPGDFLDALEAIKYLNPDIVSISAGAIGNPNDEYSMKVKELRERGIIVIAAAAGNLGPTPGTILSPACSDYAIAVGSFDTKGTPSQSDDVICLWSSRGPVPDISPKPDVVAPGESIRGPWMYTERSKSGTSMSTPLIVGGTAIVVAQNKPLLDIVKTIYFWNLGVVGDAYEGALKDSCTLLGDENAWGAGVPNFVEVNDNFRNRLLLLISIPIVIIILIVAIAIYFYKRK